MADEEKFFLVTIKEDAGEPECLEFTTQDEFTKAISERVLEAEQSAWVFAFRGKRITLSNPHPVCELSGLDSVTSVSGPSGGVSSSGLITPLVKKKPQGIR